MADLPVNLIIQDVIGDANAQKAIKRFLDGTQGKVKLVDEINSLNKSLEQLRSVARATGSDRLVRELDRIGSSVGKLNSTLSSSTKSIQHLFRDLEQQVRKFVASGIEDSDSIIQRLIRGGKGKSGISASKLTSEVREELESRVFSVLRQIIREKKKEAESLGAELRDSLNRGVIGGFSSRGQAGQAAFGEFIQNNVTRPQAIDREIEELTKAQNSFRRSSQANKKREAFEESREAAQEADIARRRTADLQKIAEFETRAKQGIDPADRGVFVDKNAKARERLNKATKEYLALQRQFKAAGGDVSQVQLINKGSIDNIKEASRQLRNLTRELHKQKTQLENTSFQAVKFGQQMALAFKRFLAFLTPTSVLFSLVLAFRQGVSEALKFEAVLTKIEQATDNSAVNMQKISRAILDASSKTGVGGSDIAQGINLLAQAGFKSVEELSSVASLLAKTQLAPTFGSIEETVDGLIAVFGQFNLTLNDTGSILDTVNKFAADFAVESKDIFEGVKRGGSAFQTAGGSLQEFIELFSVLRSETRESASSLGVFFKTGVSKLFSGDSQGILRRLGVGPGNITEQLTGLAEAFKGLSGIDKIAISSSLVGERQFARLLSLTQALEDPAVQRQLQGARSSSFGSVDASASKRLDDLGNAFQRVRSEFNRFVTEFTQNQAIKDFAISISNLAKTLIDLARVVTPLLPQLLTLAGLLAAPTIKKTAGSFTKNIFGFGLATEKPTGLGRGLLLSRFGSGFGLDRRAGLGSGFRGSFNRGIANNIGGVALGGAIGGSLALDQMDNKFAKAGSSALSLGATLGTLGFLIGGPFGAAIGGAIGALGGFTSTLFEVSNQQKQDRAAGATSVAASFLETGPELRRLVGSDSLLSGKAKPIFQNAVDEFNDALVNNEGLQKRFDAEIVSISQALNKTFTDSGIDVDSAEGKKIVSKSIRNAGSLLAGSVASVFEIDSESQKKVSEVLKGQFSQLIAKQLGFNNTLVQTSTTGLTKDTLNETKLLETQAAIFNNFIDRLAGQFKQLNEDLEFSTNVLSSVVGLSQNVGSRITETNRTNLLEIAERRGVVGGGLATSLIVREFDIQNATQEIQSVFEEFNQIAGQTGRQSIETFIKSIGKNIEEDLQDESGAVKEGVANQINFFSENTKNLILRLAEESGVGVDELLTSLLGGVETGLRSANKFEGIADKTIDALERVIQQEAIRIDIERQLSDGLRNTNQQIFDLVRNLNSINLESTGRGIEGRRFQGGINDAQARNLQASALLTSGIAPIGGSSLTDLRSRILDAAGRRNAARSDVTDQALSGLVSGRASFEADRDFADAQSELAQRSQETADKLQLLVQATDQFRANLESFRDALSNLGQNVLGSDRSQFIKENDAARQVLRFLGGESGITGRSASDLSQRLSRIDPEFLQTALAGFSRLSPIGTVGGVDFAEILRRLTEASGLNIAAQGAGAITGQNPSEIAKSIQDNLDKMRADAEKAFAAEQKLREDQKILVGIQLQVAELEKKFYIDQQKSIENLVQILSRITGIQVGGGQTNVANPLEANNTAISALTDINTSMVGELTSLTTSVGSLNVTMNDLATKGLQVNHEFAVEPLLVNVTLTAPDIAGMIAPQVATKVLEALKPKLIDAFQGDARAQNIVESL